MQLRSSIDHQEFTHQKDSDIDFHSEILFDVDAATQETSLVSSKPQTPCIRELRALEKSRKH